MIYLSFSFIFFCRSYLSLYLFLSFFFTFLFHLTCCSPPTSLSFFFVFRFGICDLAFFSLLVPPFLPAYYFFLTNMFSGSLSWLSLVVVFLIYIFPFPSFLSPLISVFLLFVMSLALSFMICGFSPFFLPFFISHCHASFVRYSLGLRLVFKPDPSSVPCVPASFSLVFASVFTVISARRQGPASEKSTRP